MGRGLLGSIFNVLDPVLDTVDPMHNKVQEWTTGSKERDKQSPYFEEIAPWIVDYFAPGWGSALAAADGASTGNWTKAGLSALGSYAGFAGAGSSAATGAGEGLTATEGLQAAEGLQATEGLASTSGYAAGDLGSGIGNSNAYTLGHTGDYSGAFAATPSYKASGELLTLGNAPVSSMEASGATGGGLLSNQSTGVTGQLQLSGNLGGSATAPSQYVGLGDKFNSTGTLSANQLYNNQPWYTKGNSSDVKQAAKAYGSYEKTVATEQQKKRQEEAMRNAETRQMMNQAMAGMGGDTQRRPVASFAQTSPYASFQGGFNPKRYGANVRQQGLLG